MHESNDAFDAELVRLARIAGDQAYDPAVGLIAQQAKYNPIHTRVWTGLGHPHRESVVYALVLLESGDGADLALAEEILLRVLAAQDTDDASPTYGIWSYYHEEPLDQMVPPDWNWADFIGRELAFILFRHEARLTEPARLAVRTALGHAARSIIRRNVAMSYTNIAAKGTFVTLAAGQLLKDDELTEYAVRRVGRLQEQIRTAGSFAEYNSAGYWTITLEAIAAIVQYIDDPEAVSGARWIVDRLWDHFVARWHSRTGQLSGPMARVYTDEPARGPDLLALLAKASGFRGGFAELPALKPTLGLLGVALVNVEAPLVERLLDSPTGELRERFSYVDPGEGRDPVPVIGTTWHGRDATLGSANVGEFWLQRRPVIGYWREPGDPAWGPARFVKLHVMKDDHDFSSAVFVSAQSGSQVLWSVSFVSPGGDEHIGLHQIEAGQSFAVSSLRLVLELAGADDATVEVAGRPVTEGPVGIGEQFRVSTRGVDVVGSVDSVSFGDRRPELRVERTADRILLVVELLSDGPTELTMRDISPVEVTGTLSLFEGVDRPEVAVPSVTLYDGDVQAHWVTTDGTQLRLVAPARVTTKTEHPAGVRATVDGDPVIADGLAR
ncbi:hypothetical protein [Kribbella shirazensis]|uniref:Heparinase II/III-like protein n=1 Tax=Kribbella shirazensis TaxID=1105143 RepID=A0A7X5VIR5_9ACTN|nr:hypothetical protein [Kribbella shirazensis]NIK62020.1 hypothetical protein [Kribbella shirazensis]